MEINFGKYRLEQRGDDWWLIINGEAIRGQTKTRESVIIN